MSITRRTDRPVETATRDVTVDGAKTAMAGHVKQCIDNLMQLANGVTVEEDRGNDDGPVVYKKPPDRAANEYILNQILGRPASKKPIAEPELSEVERFDLSKIPLDRLQTIEQWLTEKDEEC